MKLYFIRHGETEKNKEKVLQGRSDAPLNAAGIRQAEEVRDLFLGEGIRFERVYTSPLLRAVQTARIIAGEKIPLITDERLLEMDYGPYEGISLTDPPAEPLSFFRDFVNHPAPEGMEPLSAVVDRAGAFLRDIEKEGLQGDGSLLISAHAISMKGALEYLTPASKGAYWSTYVGNCAIFISEYKNGRFSVPKEWKPEKEG